MLEVRVVSNSGLLATANETEIPELVCDDTVQLTPVILAKVEEGRLLHMENLDENQVALVFYNKHGKPMQLYLDGRTVADEEYMQRVLHNLLHLCSSCMTVYNLSEHRSLVVYYIPPELASVVKSKRKVHYHHESDYIRHDFTLTRILSSFG